MNYLKRLGFATLFSLATALSSSAADAPSLKSSPDPPAQSISIIADKGSESQMVGKGNKPHPATKRRRARSPTNSEYNGSIQDLFADRFHIPDYDDRVDAVRDTLPDEYSGYTGTYDENVALYNLLTGDLKRGEGKIVKPFFDYGRGLATSNGSNDAPGKKVVSSDTSSNNAGSLAQKVSQNSNKETEPLSVPAPEAPPVAAPYAAPAPAPAQDTTNTPPAYQGQGISAKVAAAKARLAAMRQERQQAAENRGSLESVVNQHQHDASSDAPVHETLSQPVHRGHLSQGSSTNQPSHSHSVSQPSSGDDTPSYGAGHNQEAPALSSSQYDNLRRAVGRVASRTHSHQQNKNSKGLVDALYGSMLVHNPFPLFSDRTPDYYNSQFASSINTALSHYQQGGASGLTKHDQDMYAHAREWLNDAFGRSERLRNGFAKVAGREWSASAANQDMNNYGVRQMHYEFFAAQQEFWKDHCKERDGKILWYVGSAVLGFALGGGFGGHGGHHGIHLGGHHGYVGGGFHHGGTGIIPPFAGGAHR